ncbi:bifunctional 2-polyprenyl-6-hydroxyphenol methylase/3-demethylubiquinol 3-O-methyltransferase UbiG [Methylocapsa sp. S129]|uniref:class I SAM-dependent methyltransferase n=1 Tax=Methylocapsa sp. S129 TaxID=1641869 RepID=UPI00131A9DB9|nr:class I SAM-dependent methyltransferase [Methylocapsa sp. S129]
MTVSKQPTSKPDQYWERAGEVSYAQHMFSSALVEEHVNRRLWNVALAIADELGAPASGHVLDLGCGDGAFAIQALAGRYRQIDGYDKAEAAIERANNAVSGPTLHFAAADLVKMDYSTLPRYDAVFMIGFLHHVKAATPDIVKKIAGVTDRVIVLEPNGNHLLRKTLELTPTYRSAGEDSFKTDEMKQIFAAAGFKTAVWRRMNLFPNFTPGFLYRLLAPLETKVESNNVLKALCTVNMFGFDKAASAQARG